LPEIELANQTDFASAQRAEADEVAALSRTILALGLMTHVLEAVNDLVLVLNEHRQIVFANRNFLSLLGAKDLSAVLGMRPGESVGCAVAKCSPGGCGTGKACSTCGAVNAILSSLKGLPDSRECRILRDDDALDLAVRTTPFEDDDHRFVICSICDISDSKRRRALERIFFHDVLNTAGGVTMLAQRVADGNDKPDDRLRLHELVSMMADDIQAQRDLMAAESSELLVRAEPFSTLELLQNLTRLYFNSPVCKDRWLNLEESPDVTLNSDRRLVARVLGNLLKNALEATPADGVVDISMAPAEGGVEFFVRNPGVIPLEVQLQLFQRSFSTKGAGRGLGTYSVKLLTERYLGGRVWVNSNPDDGTVFHVWYPMTLAGK
jgi:nitrogen fixation/metabolism regulation signal transduction histidine kinase